MPPNRGHCHDAHVTRPTNSKQKKECAHHQFIKGVCVCVCVCVCVWRSIVDRSRKDRERRKASGRAMIGAADGCTKVETRQG